MRPALVYEIVNKVDAKSYIGVAVDLRQRLRVHMHHVRNGTGFKVHAAIRKHGAASFCVRVRARLPSQEEAYLAERVLVALEKPEYNLTAGGEGVRATPEVRQKIATKARGRRPSEATKQKIREARARQVNLPVGPFDEAHRANMSAAQKGKKQSADTRAKRRAALKRAYAEGRRSTHFRTAMRSADGRVLPRKGQG